MARNESPEAFVVPGDEIDIDWDSAIPLAGFATAALTDVYGDENGDHLEQHPVIGLWLRSAMGSIVTTMPTQAAEALIAKLQAALIEHSDGEADDISAVTGLILPSQMDDPRDPDRKHDDG